MYAFIFPGQGSQTIGMGSEVYKAFSVARDVFGEVNEALGQNLTKLIFDGHQSDLTLTQNAQPALMTASLAIMAVLTKEGGIRLEDKVKYVAGHSLGEYSALAAAGAFSIQDTARLLRTRGNAMQQAVAPGDGAMAALLGVDIDQAGAIADAASFGQVCVIANDNGGGQVVLSGATDAIHRAIDLGPSMGAKKCVLLPVSAPFHCPLMEPARLRMEEALEGTSPKTPQVPVISNVTATATQDADEIRQLLVDQVTGRVRWRETILYLESQGITTLVEVGAGKVLTGLTKRISGDLQGITLNTPQDIEVFLKTF